MIMIMIIIIIIIITCEIWGSHSGLAEVKTFCLDCLTLQVKAQLVIETSKLLTYCNAPEHLDLQYQRCQISEDIEPAGSCLRLLFVEFFVPLSLQSVLFSSAGTILEGGSTGMQLRKADGRDLNTPGDARHEQSRRCETRTL